MTSSAPEAGPWAAIDSHAMARLDELFVSDPERLSRLSLEVGGMYFDWSKTHIDADYGACEDCRAGALPAKREALSRRRDRQRQ